MCKFKYSSIKATIAYGLFYLYKRAYLDGTSITDRKF